MKNLNKKLYSVITACLLMLCFTIVAMATNGTDGSDIPSSSQEVTDSSKNDDIDSSSKTEPSSNDTSEADSFEVVSSENSEDKTSSAAESASSDITTSEQANSLIASSENTSSKKANYSNIGGVVNDEQDDSEWGANKDKVSSESEETDEDDTKKRKEKNITDYSDILWILIWIPVLLILASVGALVYVNRKEFLQEDGLSFDDSAEPDSNKKKVLAEEKAKRKNNHKNRTNVYRPRD